MARRPVIPETPHLEQQADMERRRQKELQRHLDEEARERRRAPGEVLGAVADGGVPAVQRPAHPETSPLDPKFDKEGCRQKELQRHLGEEDCERRSPPAGVLRGVADGGVSMARRPVIPETPHLEQQADMERRRQKELQRHLDEEARERRSAPGEVLGAVADGGDPGAQRPVHPDTSPLDLKSDKEGSRQKELQRRLDEEERESCRPRGEVLGAVPDGGVSMAQQPVNSETLHPDQKADKEVAAGLAAAPEQRAGGRPGATPWRAACACMASAWPPGRLGQEFEGECELARLLERIRRRRDAEACIALLEETVESDDFVALSEEDRERAFNALLHALAG